jgi:LCP family protein required for cell wall assembly
VARTVRIMSIPRDLIVNIPGYGENKVNAAYLFGEYYKEPGGGQALSVQTVSEFFDVSIEYYLAVNFDGFRKVIDTIGGIEVDVPYTLDDYDYPTDDEGDPYGTTHEHFDQGLQHMDGKTALRNARTRHADNDFARSRRQLQIINAVRQKAMTLDLLPKAPGLIDDLGGMIETNIPFDQQLALAQLGYNLAPSGVISASIDASMIVPKYLDDGSEGFGLDWDVAGPMLDEFFGLTLAADDAGARADAQVSDEEGGAAGSTGEKAPTTGKSGTAPKPKGEMTASPTPRRQR